MHLNKKAIIKLLITFLIYTSIGCGPGYYFQKGELAFDQKNYTEALLNFRKVLNKDKEFPRILSKIETTEFNIAKKEDTIPAYKQFIEKYPEGHFCYESKRIIDNKLYEVAKKEDTIDAYMHYQKVTLLKQDSDGHWREALNEINRIRLKKANDAISVKNYESALILYKNIIISDPGYPNIKEFIERAEYNLARETDTRKGWQIFLKKYPRGTYTSEAKKELDQLLYRKATTINTIEAYNQYFSFTPLPDGQNGRNILNRMFSEGLRLLFSEQCKKAFDYFQSVKNRNYNYPFIQSRINLATSCNNNRNKTRIVENIKTYIRGEEALSKKQYREALDSFEKISDERHVLPYKLVHYIEDAEFHIAKQTHTEKSLKDFLDKYPRGRYVDQVDLELNMLMQRKAYNKAQQKGSLSALSQFIKKYPQTRYAMHAKKDIESLIDMHEYKDFKKAKRGGINSLKKFIKKYQDYQNYARYIDDARDAINVKRKQHTRAANEKKAKAKDLFDEINKLADEAIKKANESLRKGRLERNKSIKDLQSIISRIKKYDSTYSKSKYRKKLFKLSNDIQKLCIKINPDISTSIH